MRLVRSDLRRPGITRVRDGDGFAYRDPAGRTVTDRRTLERIRELAVPPAWEHVWICPVPRGHVQAVGFDAAGRRQYLYHESWRKQRDEEKFDRVLRLAERLPAVRAEIAAELERGGLSRDRVLAAAVRMLDEGVFRTGGEQYAQSNATRGVATLQREHVAVRRDRVDFGYPAKGGVRRTLSLRDGQLARLFKVLQKREDERDRLLSYRAEDGWHHVRSEEINERIKELVGAEFSAKDLRTWNATVHAAVIFAEMERPTSKAAGRRAVRSAMVEVADSLGNTASMARKSYVDPLVVDLFLGGTTIRTGWSREVPEDRPDDELRNEVDRAVCRMLWRERSPDHPVS